MEIRKLDVVRVVVARVVDQAVDRVNDDPGDAPIAVGFHFHPVRSQNANHALDITLENDDSIKVFDFLDFNDKISR